MRADLDGTSGAPARWPVHETGARDRSRVPDGELRIAYDHREARTVFEGQARERERVKRQ
jgi:hypothetical protein